MVAKKSPKANLESKKTVSLLLGLVVALSVVYISFEWSSKDIKVHQVNRPIEVPQDIVNIVQTNPDKPTPPPPPPPPKPVIVDELNVVKNTAKVNNLDSLFIEDFNKPIVAVPYTPPVEDTTDLIIDFVKVEKMPVFKDDLPTFLGKNLKYPRVAADTGIHGRVICEFIINKDGSVSDIKVLKSIDPSLDEEAVRVIGLMPAWEPGIQQGKPVRVKYRIPVTFRLK